MKCFGNHLYDETTNENIPFADPENTRRIAFRLPEGTKASDFEARQSHETDQHGNRYVIFELILTPQTNGNNE